MAAGHLHLICLGRSWGFGLGQSDKQRKHFEQQLQTLADAWQKHGGPYLTGTSISLVSSLKHVLSTVLPLMGRLQWCRACSSRTPVECTALSVHSWHHGESKPLHCACLAQADLIIFPFVDRFALCAPSIAAYNVREACNGAIGAWLDAMSARPSCKVSCANSEALLHAYRCASGLHSSALPELLERA